MPHFFLPSLFHRLRDEHPRDKKEPPSAQVVSKNDYEEMVKGDIQALINASPLPTHVNTGAARDGLTLSDFPHVEESVLNYGLQDLGGLTLAPEMAADW